MMQMTEELPILAGFLCYKDCEDIVSHGCQLQCNIRGGNPREKGAGNVRVAEKERAESGISRRWENRETGKHETTFRNILLPRKAAANKNETRTGIKGEGERDIQVPVVPPPYMSCSKIYQVRL